MQARKFRGVSVDGKYYFGDLIHNLSGWAIRYFDDEINHVRYIKVFKVAQLVGYDARGNEVYEEIDPEQEQILFE